ncbi:nitrate reductase associated protein [Vasconcelosia minhoensis]|nr:nitrate reductase associated protein [Romeria gracilis]
MTSKPFALMTAIMSEPFFQFEQDFIDSLRCVPMQVRLKLDTCGVKLKLEHWNHFTPAQKQHLVQQPCQSAAEVTRYRQQLQEFVTQQAGAPAKSLEIEPHPPWLDPATVPEVVREQARAHEIVLPVEQWAELTPLQRFALIKLSRSSHENRNFLPAVKEFGLRG